MGRAGLFATSLSVALTFAVAVLGPSVMEPALPGRPGQPPWAVAAHLPPALAVALTAAALAAGTLGLGLCLRAMHRGWLVPPWAVLGAGIAAAALLVLVPPLGSSDHLSYAAYGRMVTTGHDPYTTTPAMLARLGDPVANAVQDWRTSPSVYGSLATAGQALASLAGGTSVRLTVFVLGLLDVAAFAGTGLLLHLMTRGSEQRQCRAALLWTFNPLLLQVLVAGEHVDSQAIVFGVAAIAVFSLGLRGGAGQVPAARRFLVCAAAGGLAGLGASVKVTMVLIVAGLILAAVAAWRRHRRWLGVAAGGLVTGFAVVAAASLAPWGLATLRPALHAGSFVSIGSPWRVVRFGFRLIVGEGIANDLVRVGALVLGALLLGLLLRALPVLAAGTRAARPARDQGRPSGDGGAWGMDLAGLAAWCVFACVFAWLVAWPYVLPWYDGLGWAALGLLPVAAPAAQALDWLLLARTAALAFGYLPARGITMPADLGWLRSVVRTGVTPVILLAVTVGLVVFLWRLRPRSAGPDLLQVPLSVPRRPRSHVDRPEQ
jgi:alpha-1,6-mannosyltransferase